MGITHTVKEIPILGKFLKPYTNPYIILNMYVPFLDFETNIPNHICKNPHMLVTIIPKIHMLFMVSHPCEVI